MSLFWLVSQLLKERPYPRQVKRAAVCRHPHILSAKQETHRATVYACITLENVLHGELRYPSPRGAQGPPGRMSGGVTYVRWGKSSCPDQPDTELVCAVYTGGTHSRQNGGANHLCMPPDPEYSKYIPGVQGESYVHGAEYDNPISGSQHGNVPSRVTLLVAPAKTSCPSSWIREYSVYIMSEGRRQSDIRCLSAWTAISSRFRAVRTTEPAQIFTTLKLFVVACPALLMLITRN